MDRRQSGVRPRGNSIQLEFSYQGIRCRETIKLSPTKVNIALVFKQKSAIEYQIATNQFDYFQHFPLSKKALKLSSNPAQHIRLKDQLNKWLKVAQKRCQYSTVRDYITVITKHLEPKFGDLRLNELRTSDVEEWISTLPYSNKRINNILIPLRQCMELAYTDNLIDKNPMDKVKGLKIATREPNPFTEVEIQKILYQLESSAKNLIQFAFSTGLRTSELLGLQWGDVDLDKNAVHIRRAIVRKRIKEPKTKSGYRTLKLLTQASEALENQIILTGNASEYVFRDPRDNLSDLNDKKIRESIWIPALKKANVKYREPYQTRHTFASMMLMQGKSPMWVSRQLGHSSPIQTFQSYARWIDQDE